MIVVMRGGRGGPQGVLTTVFTKNDSFASKTFFACKTLLSRCWLCRAVFLLSFALVFMCNGLGAALLRLAWFYVYVQGGWGWRGVGRGGVGGVREVLGGAQGGPSMAPTWGGLGGGSRGWHGGFPPGHQKI